MLAGVAVWCIMCVPAACRDNYCLNAAASNESKFRIRVQASDDISHHTDDENTNTDKDALSQNHGKPLLNYMRISKTGSTTLIDALTRAKKASPAACSPLRIHNHDVTADVLATLQNSTHPSIYTSFVVLREPCQRFASIYSHLKVHLPKDDSIYQTRTPEQWGRLLLRNSSLRNSFLYHGAREAVMHHRIPWQQSAYVSNTSMVACLPSMFADVQRFLNDFARGCTMHVHVNGTKSHTVKNRLMHPPCSSKCCEIASILYAEDVSLWNRRCANSTFQNNRSSVRHR